MKSKASGAAGLTARMERDFKFHMGRGRSFEAILAITGYSRMASKPIYIRLLNEKKCQIPHSDGSSPGAT